MDFTAEARRMHGAKCRHTQQPVDLAFQPVALTTRRIHEMSRWCVSSANHTETSVITAIAIR